MEPAFLSSAPCLGLSLAEGSGKPSLELTERIDQLAPGVCPQRGIATSQRALVPAYNILLKAQIRDPGIINLHHGFDSTVEATH